MIGAWFSNQGASAQPAWLLTMTDLILLLLTFFTMLFTVSRPDPVRYPEIAQSYVSTFAADAVSVPPGAAQMSFAETPAKQGDNVAYLDGVLRTAFAASPTLGRLQFRRAGQYLVLSLTANDVFPRGGAVPTAASAAMLFDLAGVLGNLKNPIAIVGVGGGWALGLNRAENVAAALVAAGWAARPSVLARSAGVETLEVVIFADRSPY